MKKIELIGKRKPKEKHFLQEDGSIVAEMFDQRIHFFKNGHYEDINNSLIKQGNFYTNCNNDYKIFFPIKNSSRIIRLEKGDKFVDFYINNNDNYDTLIMNSENKLLSNICLKDILNNIDLMYSLEGQKIKENIILKSKEFDIKNLFYSIKTNLKLKIEENGSILILDQDEVIFIIEKPFIVDSKKNINNNCKYILEKLEDEYKLILSLDEKWCRENENYPLVIDPTITEKTDINSVIDTYIFPNDTNVTRGNLDYLKVGVEKQNGIDVINRTLLKFDLPDIGTGSQIIDAKLYLNNYPYITSEIINDIIDIHRMTSDWTEMGANWNDMNNAYDGRVEGAFNYYGWYFLNQNNEPTIMTEIANITSLVQKWYTDTPNYGIMLKLSEEQYKQDIIPLFFSKNYQNYVGESPKPILAITYRNQNGLEDYLNYESHVIGKANVYHNVYNGNMTSVIDLCSTNIGKFPASLKLIYNTNDVVLNKNRGFGLGYKLNYNQILKEVMIDTKIYIEYEDEDGTIHYFSDSRRVNNGNGTIVLNEDDTYYDEDGLDLIIKKYNDRYELIDKENNKMIFSIYNNIGYLIQLIDSKGNIISINYDINYNNIISIVDADSQSISITYDNNNNCITVVGPTDNITLNFFNSELSSIIYLDEDMHFNYYSNHCISSIGLGTTNYRRIEYEYYSKIPYKLKKVSEYGLNSLGNWYETSYNFNSTTIIDSKNRAKTICFNSSGNPESISSLSTHDDIKNAYGIKLSYGNSFYGLDMNKNELLEELIPIKYVDNLLKNTSFEENNIYFTGDHYSEISISNEFANTGDNSLRFKSTSGVGECRIKQFINIEGDKYYTFSAYVKTSLWYTPAKLYIRYEDNQGIIHEEVSEKIVSDEFERLDTTIYVPAGLYDSEIMIGISLEGTGLCFIDDIQLEASEVLNNYNLISNSDFSDGLNDWTLYSSKYNTNDVFSVVTINGQKALKTKMYTHNSTSFERTFPIKGKAGDKFTLSFWYKNTGLNGSELFTDEPQNNAIITFYPTDPQIGGDVIENYPLNPNENEWQYFIYTYTAGYDFSSLKLSLQQYLNGNDFYITNINLFKDISSVKNSYDNKGNLISKKGLNNTSKTFAYDKNNELIKSIDKMGKVLYYEYDNISKKDVLRSISNGGLQNEIEYDTFNNPKFIRIRNRETMLIPTDGSYCIRMKGTKKMLSVKNNVLFMIEDNHKHAEWVLEKVVVDDKDYYKIHHNLINDKFLVVNENIVYLSNYQNENSLFELIMQNNGSYIIKSKNSSKYIMFDNNIFSASELIDDDFRFQFYFEKLTNNSFVENSIEYDPSGKYITKQVDANFKIKEFGINPNTNLITYIERPNKYKEMYEYNSKKYLSKVENSKYNIQYEYNSDNTLLKITQGDRIYNFEYNDFQKISKIKLGSNIDLIQNTYDSNNGNIELVKYGNNQTIQYEYDEFERIKSVNKTNDTFNYIYDNNGNLSKIKSQNCGIQKYIYDMGKRLYKYCFGNFIIKYLYDNSNNILKKEFNYNNDVHSLNYTLNDLYATTKIQAESQEFNYIYDNLGRITSSNVNGMNINNFSYYSNGLRLSSMIKKHENIFGNYHYIYDKFGNIVQIKRNGLIEKEYFYDSVGELIKENNYILNKTIKYIYNNLGNIIYKKENDINTDNQLSQNKYKYLNANFPDQLTQINGESLSYDSAGNLLCIGNNVSLTWVDGRHLNTFTKGNLNISYKYNANGIRISKNSNINGITDYYLENDEIVIEKNNNNVLYYIRSNVDGLVGFKYNSSMYFYVKNIQDDIIGILDSNYNVVAKYDYDSWGNIIKITNGNDVDVSNDMTHIANINPFRYRSYYYDKETELYYLNSRYYNPKWGRFINPDNYISTDSGPLGFNMYLYCNNDPINKKDPNGHAIVAGLVIGLAVVGALFLANTIYRTKKAKKEIKEVQKKKNIPDRTKEIDKTLEKNAQTIVSRKYQNEPPKVTVDRFINAVKSGGEMDLKRQPEFQETISYNGIIMEPEDIGNFNYGYIGRAYGFSADVLRLGAGGYQLYEHYDNPVTYLNCFTPSICDDPRDTYFIEMGMIKYDQEHQKK